jgi:hypothetical protein
MFTIESSPGNNPPIQLAGSFQRFDAAMVFQVYVCCPTTLKSAPLNVSTIATKPKSLLDIFVLIIRKIKQHSFSPSYKGRDRTSSTFTGFRGYDIKLCIIFSEVGSMVCMFDLQKCWPNILRFRQMGGQTATSRFISFIQLKQIKFFGDVSHESYWASLCTRGAPCRHDRPLPHPVVAMAGQRDSYYCTSAP